MLEPVGISYLKGYLCPIDRFTNVLPYDPKKLNLLFIFAESVKSWILQMPDGMPCFSSIGVGS